MANTEGLVVIPALVMLLLAAGLPQSYATTEDQQNMSITEDWPMLGGGPLRNFYRPHAIALPLQMKWRYETSRAPVTFYIGSSPAVYRRLVIVGGEDGILRGLSVQDGKALWAFQTNG